MEKRTESRCTGGFEDDVTKQVVRHLGLGALGVGNGIGDTVRIR